MYCFHFDVNCFYFIQKLIEDFISHLKRSVFIETEIPKNIKNLIPLVLSITQEVYSELFLHRDSLGREAKKMEQEVTKDIEFS